ncbi:MAG TPA: IPT/TIG domain-containing protein [Dehalococcoidia bacterium]|nr:IPT/TIG domain-containing protein [Dehalococcoidia bacterium]
MHIKRIQVAVIAGLLLLLPVLPQLVLADGPGIYDISVTDITGTTAEISWNTNTTSDSRVNYGDTIGLGTTAYVSSNSTTHNIILTGLLPGTKYYFEVQSTDEIGTSTDDNGGAFYSFITVAPAEYSITVEPVCGVCGELVEVGICGEVIGVTAHVAMAGTYHICWDSVSTATVKDTFIASGPGVYEVTFFLPESAKGIHTVYLVDSTPVQKASATFEVLPFVRINTEEGPVGTNVTFNGYGFVASQQIQIIFKGAVIGSTAANGVGSWTIAYAIPATNGGGYAFEIQAKEGTDFWTWVLKYFKVTPKITVMPNSGTVRQTVAVNGSGFAKDEDGIKITFDGKVVKENIYAGEDGSWSAVIAVPAVQNDRYAIDASGTSTRARYVPDVEFTVVPGIWVEPISAYIGDTITVTGGGFALGETGIRIYFDGMDVTPATITANMSGCWESFFALPTSTYGSHTVSASGDITQPAVTKTVNTQARILQISPVEGAPGDSVSLHGDGFHGGQQLTVSVGGVAASVDMPSQSNGNVDVSFRVPRGSVEGQQTVVVTDVSGASDSVAFTVTRKILSMTPLPISPKDSTLRSGMVTFRWQGMTGSTGNSYTLEISGEGSAWSKSIAESTYPLTEDEALGKGTYHWRVKIIDDYGNEGPWSESIEFRVSPIPTWVWVLVGLVVLVVLLVVAYRETKFRVTE